MKENGCANALIRVKARRLFRCLFDLILLGISWSYVGTCEFKGKREEKKRNTSFVAQIVTGNAIRTVVEVGYTTGESLDKRSLSRNRCSMKSQKWYTI